MPQLEVSFVEPPELTLEEMVAYGDTSTSSIKKFIEEEAVRQEVSPDLAARIAQCESGFNYKVKNTKSTAQGTFQFINSTWQKTMEKMGLPTTTEKIDPIIGVRAGVWLLKKEGVGHWEESRYCWGSVYDELSTG